MCLDEVYTVGRAIGAGSYGQVFSGFRILDPKDKVSSVRTQTSAQP